MSTKLTLTIDKELIAQAKSYAKSKNRSLSDLISSYLKMVTAKEEASEKLKISPALQGLRGSFKPPKTFNYKKELLEELEKKFL